MSDYYRNSLVQVDQQLRNGSVTSQLGILNRCQGDHLKRRLALHQEEFESAKRMLCNPICEEFYRIVEHAECLLRDCSNGEEGLYAVIRLADQREAFVKILCELEWCMIVIRTFLRLNERDFAGDVQLEILKELVNTEWISKQEDIRRQIDEVVGKDREELRSKLESLQRSCNIPKQEGRVLDKLLQRLSTQEDHKEHYDFLFEIQPEELKFIRFLGEGAYGSVSETTWLGKSHATKVFKESDNESFQKEAAVLAPLCHPHVVQLFGRSVEPTRCSLVMEVMSTDLQKVIDTSKGTKGCEIPFQYPVALDILLQIAEGMQYLHAQKVAHRDLKPANILVNPVDIPELAARGYVHAKIADFGLSKTKDSSISYSKVIPNQGTTRYMAPEHFLDDDLGSHRKYLLKADVYSYAITAYQILTGIVPYTGISQVELRRLVKYEHVRPELSSAEFPQLLTSLIKRCWDAEACRRPSFKQICLELRHLKGLLMLGAGSQQLEAIRFPIHPGEEESKRASTYQAYLTAASSSRAEVTTSVTRILVVGYKGAGKTDFIKKFCGMNQNNADDDKSSPEGAAILEYMNREWHHPSLPLVIHDSKDLGHNGADIDRIAQFLKQRNRDWTYDALQAVATKVLRPSILGKQGEDLENLNKNRIHLVWLVYSVLEKPQTEWKQLMDVIRDMELPVQLLITNTEKDPSGEKLKKNYLENRGYLFTPSIPQQEQILTISSAITTASTTVIKEADPNLHQETRCVENVNAEQLWATSQVVTVKHQIQQTAKIISRLASRLRRNGTVIASAPFTNLSRSYSLSQTAVFSFKCLCKMWEVPSQMAAVLYERLVSWEFEESFNRTNSKKDFLYRIPSFKKPMPRSNSDPIGSSSADKSRALKLEPGRFLGFVIRIASLLLFCKARHLKGWVQEGPMMDAGYSLEVNSYYHAHSAKFNELNEHHFGVLAQFKRICTGVSGKQDLHQRLQKSLEEFFENVLDCSPKPSPVVVDIPVGDESKNVLVTSCEPVVPGPLDGASHPQPLLAVLMAINVQRWNRLRLNSLWSGRWIVNFFVQSSRRFVQMCLRRSSSDSGLRPLVE